MAIPMEEFEPEYNKLTTQNVAEMLGVLPRTVTNYVKSGKLSPCHKGRFGKLYFEEEAILSFKIKNKVAKSGPQPPSHNRPPKRTDYEMKIIKEWQVQPKDVFSIDVQIGLLTHKIEYIEEKLIFLQKDELNFRLTRIHLLKLLNERRKSLDFLRSTDTARYKKAIDKIGINI